MREPVFNAKVSLPVPLYFEMALTAFPHRMRASVA
jgi:hypothetical protein